jgi:catechol 2,3-dioxygenase-like lactoylglutathione lyase family enzyme
VHLNLTVADAERSVEFYGRWFRFYLGRRGFADGTVLVLGAVTQRAPHPKPKR